MNTKIHRAAGWFIIVLIICQFVPMNRINPPARDREKLPADVRKILKKNCYDCHSLENHWPRSAYIAPLSWFVVHEIEKGRKALNFSVHINRRTTPSNSSKPAVRTMLLSGELSTHPQIPGIPAANLSGEELRILVEWTGTR